MGCWRPCFAILARRPSQPAGPSGPAVWPCFPSLCFVASFDIPASLNSAISAFWMAVVVPGTVSLPLLGTRIPTHDGAGRTNTLEGLVPFPLLLSFLLIFHPHSLSFRRLFFVSSFVIRVLFLLVAGRQFSRKLVQFSTSSNDTQHKQSRCSTPSSLSLLWSPPSWVPRTVRLRREC